jgi:hypothetical protein
METLNLEHNINLCCLIGETYGRMATRANFIISSDFKCKLQISVLCTLFCDVKNLIDFRPVPSKRIYAEGGYLPILRSSDKLVLNYCDGSLELGLL